MNKIKSVTRLFLFGLVIPALSACGPSEIHYSFKLDEANQSWILQKDKSYEEQTTIEIPTTHEGLPVAELGGWTFYGCQKITKMAIPFSIKKIGSITFGNCKSLQEVSIPASVIEIGTSWFIGANQVKSLTVAKDNKVFDSRDGCNAIIHTETNSLAIACLASTVPNGVVEIGKEAFCGLDITSINLPSSVLRIGWCAFAGCEKLTTFAVPSNVTELSERVFEKCVSLESISIPASLQSIGELLFWNSEKLATINYAGTMAEWKAIAKGRDWSKGVASPCYVRCSDGILNA